MFFSLHLSLAAGCAAPRDLWKQENCFENCHTECGLYAGCLNIESQEFVFAPHHPKYPHTVSRLDWTANDVWILGARGKAAIPQFSFDLSLDAWCKVYAGSASMVDKDFLDSVNPSDPTHISVHSQSKLKTAFAIDLQAYRSFGLTRQQCSGVCFGYLLGVKYTRFDWEAYGGHYNYNNGRSIGRFPNNLKLLTYVQHFLVPYLGLQADWQLAPQWDLNVYGKYTCFGVVVCEDDHWLRKIHFTDTFHYAHYWMAGAEVIWKYSKKYNGSLKYTFDQLNKSEGHATIKKAGKKITIAKAAGVKTMFQSLTLGINGSF